MTAFRSAKLILPFGILILAACSDSTRASRVPMTLSITNRAAGPSAALAPLADVTVANGGNTLAITKVQLVLGEIELEQATAECSSSGSNSGPGSSSGCPEIELDPVLVNVPLNDAVTTLDLGALVPAGTYHELEFEIENADDDTGPEAAFLTTRPEFRGVSVLVEGTFNGQPFAFRSNLEAELELEFDTPLSVTADEPLNLTVAVDAGSWFSAVDGTVLDPSDTANALAIATNIRSSFAAFEDDDRNGVEDHRR